MAWIPGMELSRRFFHEAVEPILTEHFPDLRYAAGLIDTGSEVLGFDTEMSSDHHWGPRVLMFLQPADLAQHKQAISETLANNLPYEVFGLFNPFW